MMVVIKTGLLYKMIVIKIGNFTWNSYFINTVIMTLYGYLLRKITVTFYDCFYQNRDFYFIWLFVERNSDLWCLFWIDKDKDKDKFVIIFQMSTNKGIVT